MPVYIDTKKHMHGVKYILPQTGYAVGFVNWWWIGCVVHWAFQADGRKKSSVEEVGRSAETWRTEFAVEVVKTGRFGSAVPSVNDQGDKAA